MIKANWLLKSTGFMLAILLCIVFPLLIALPAVIATPSTLPDIGLTWEGYVSANDQVTAKLCGLVAVTPAVTTFNVRVFP